MWNTLTAILRSLKLSLLSAPYPFVFFFPFLTDQRMGGSPLSSRWHSFSPPLVTGAPAARRVARQCRMPQAPSALATTCFSLPSSWKSSQVHRHTSSSLLRRSTPSLHPQLLTTQKSRWGADGKGLGGREESPLDVGNKSDRAHWIRPRIIFLIDFTLKGVCM